MNKLLKIVKKNSQQKTRRNKLQNGMRLEQTYSRGSRKGTVGERVASSRACDGFGGKMHHISSKGEECPPPLDLLSYKKLRQACTGAVPL